MSDRGLQNERTALAWRRTGLSLLVGAVTMSRVTGSLLWLAVGVPGALGVLLLSSTTYRRRAADPRSAAPALTVLVSGATVVALGVLTLLTIDYSSVLQ